MRIGIDARLFNRKTSGIGNYLSNLLKGLTLLNNDNNKYILFTNLDAKFGEKFQIVKDPNYSDSKFYSFFWMNFILPVHLKKLNIEVFFSPNFLLPLKKIKGINNIIVIHDVIHKIDKSFHPFVYRKYLDLLLPLSIKNADKIVTISQNSKRDIIKYFNVRDDKIDVIYQSVGKEYNSQVITDDEKFFINEKYNLPSEYLLYVGVIENRKNILGLLKISDILAKRGKTIKLVLVGKPGYGFNEIKKEIYKRSDGVVYLNFVEQSDLVKLYKMSKIFLFPSYYEGFGIPPLEALMCGIPVVSSVTSSLPEIIGDGGIMFEPNDLSAFVSSIIKLLDDNEYYSSMSKKALKQSEKFSLDNSAKILVNLFAELK